MAGSGTNVNVAEDIAHMVPPNLCTDAYSATYYIDPENSDTTLVNTDSLVVEA